jgi:chemotaxis response regulator CheB
MKAKSSSMKKPKAPAGQRQVQKKAPREHTFPIVGIGASAGGLEAFERSLLPR